MRLIIKETSDVASRWVAEYIATQIKLKEQVSSEPFVLGLPTGSTPIETYKYLIEMYQKGELSFKNVVTFNMDEYVGLDEKHPESYHSFMWNELFSHIDIHPNNVHILDGNANDLEFECSKYEKAIKSVGGIDLFLGGVGEDGHIAFNEPYSSLTSRTRIKTLMEDTRRVNSRFFENDLNKVPKYALTVGVGTILDAKQVVILAFGNKKAKAVKHCVEGPISHEWTITALQMHKKGLLICDELSVGELKVNTYRYFKELENKLIQTDYEQ